MRQLCVDLSALAFKLTRLDCLALALALVAESTLFDASTLCKLVDSGIQVDPSRLFGSGSRSGG